MEKNIKPMDDINITRASVGGQIYNLFTYEDYCNLDKHVPNIAVYEDYNNTDISIVLPYRGRYSKNVVTPGIYNAGCIDFVIYPKEDELPLYTPNKIANISNKMEMKKILEKSEVMKRLDEPWITSPDNITTITIDENDEPEMVALKTAINRKRCDLDKYAPRFGSNYPNDKRQLKLNSATLKIIKRFCQNMDMEALITFRDKSLNVPNPMGSDVVVSLTEIGDED